MAKRICRTADRFDPTGEPGPRCCVRRATPPSCTAVVHEISQRDKDAFIVGEGCAGLARRQTGRDHSLPPGPGRAAPPIFSDLIYDRHTRDTRALAQGRLSLLLALEVAPTGRAT